MKTEELPSSKAPFLFFPFILHSDPTNWFSLSLPSSHTTPLPSPTGVFINFFLEIDHHPYLHPQHIPALSSKGSRIGRLKADHFYP